MPGKAKKNPHMSDVSQHQRLKWAYPDSVVSVRYRAVVWDMEGNGHLTPINSDPGKIKTWVGCIIRDLKLAKLIPVKAHKGHNLGEVSTVPYTALFYYLNHLTIPALRKKK